MSSCYKPHFHQTCYTTLNFNISAVLDRKQDASRQVVLNSSKTCGAVLFTARAEGAILLESREEKAKNEEYRKMLMIEIREKCRKVKMSPSFTHA